MLNYPIFGGMELDQIIWNYFPSLPAVYDESISYLEFLGNVLKNMNDERKHINEMGENISLFQKFVINELLNNSNNIDNKIIELFNKMLEDGSFKDIINDELLGNIQNVLAELTYKKPLITLKTSCNEENLFNVVLTNIVFSYEVVENDEKITKVELYKDNELLVTNTELKSYVIVDKIISDVTLSCKIYCESGKTYIENKHIKFYHNNYWGVSESVVSVEDIALNILTNEIITGKYYIYIVHQKDIRINNENIDITDNFIKSVITKDGINYNLYRTEYSQLDNINLEVV